MASPAEVREVGGDVVRAGDDHVEIRVGRPEATFLAWLLPASDDPGSVMMRAADAVRYFSRRDMDATTSPLGSNYRIDAYLRLSLDDVTEVHDALRRMREQGRETHAQEMLGVTAVDASITVGQLVKSATALLTPPYPE